MSIHYSLKSRKTKPRSVLKRLERLKRAIAEEKWREGDSIYSLPKYNPPKVKSAKKKDEATATTLDKTDILEQHKLAKDRKEQDKKQKKIKKETIGR